jgi:hypothetical protein
VPWKAKVIYIDIYVTLFIGFGQSRQHTHTKGRGSGDAKGGDCIAISCCASSAFFWQTATKNPLGRAETHDISLVGSFNIIFCSLQTCKSYRLSLDSTP